MFASLAECQSALVAAGAEWDLESKLTGGEHDIALIAAALMTASASAVTSLSVENNALGDTVAQLGPALCAPHVHLQKLNAAGNAIGAVGVTGLVGPALTALLLATNALGDAGAQAVAMQLSLSLSLTVLDLQKNGIGEAGGCALGLALLVRCAFVCVRVGEWPEKPRACHLAVLSSLCH